MSAHNVVVHVSKEFQEDAYFSTSFLVLGANGGDVIVERSFCNDWFNAEGNNR